MNDDRIPLLSELDPNFKQITPSGNLIDDIASAIGVDGIREQLRKTFESSDFNSKVFTFSRAGKQVSGKDILAHIKGVGVSDMVPGMAAFEASSGMMLFNPAMIKASSDSLGSEITLKANLYATAHETGHAGAHLVGELDEAKLSQAAKMQAQMPDDLLKYMGAQEKIADSFAENILGKEGFSGISSYSTLVEQQMAAAKHLGLPIETEQVIEALKAQGVDPSIRAGLMTYLGSNPLDAEKALDNLKDPKLKIMSQAYDEESGFSVLKTRIRSEPITKIGKSIESPAATSKRVTQTGNATPKARTSATGKRVFVTGEKSASTTASTAGRVQAQIVDDTIKKAASTGAPVKETAKLKSMADDVSHAVSKGVKNAGSLKMLGLAAAVGVGAIAIGVGGIKRTQQDNIDRRLEMQRKGILKQ